MLASIKQEWMREVAGHVWTLELGATSVLGGCDSKKKFPSLV